MEEIKTIQELNRRLNSYYIFNEIRNSITFERRYESARKYITYKRLRKHGLTNVQISKKLVLKSSLIRSWNKQTPHLIKMASQIPKKSLPLGIKWLNLFMDGPWRCRDFIKVPVIIRNYNDILLVLNQLNLLKNKNISYWKEDFGLISKEQAFGYVLGLMISDADKDKRSRTSLRLRIGLSKVHNWNKNIGEAFCYSLNILGIYAHRVKDGKASDRTPFGKYIWRSQLTPFLAWMKKTCLGLNFDETTTYNKVKMDWTFGASREMVIWMLNGIYDGDGCAYIRGWQITNAARPNQEFFNNLLSLFNITSKTRGPKSVIEDKSSLINSYNLPIFRFDTGKVNKMNLMAKMMRESSTVSSRKDYRKIIKRVLTLNRQENVKPKDIPFYIFKEFNVGIHPRRIYTILKRSDFYNEST